MSARKRKGASRGGVLRKTKLFLWFNVALLAVMGGWFVVQPEPRREEVSRLIQNYFEKSKRVELLDVAVDIHRLYYSPDFVAGVSAGDRTYSYGGFPKAAGLAHTIRVLGNKGYVVGYSEALQNPVWAAYRVADLRGLKDSPPRPESFEVDDRTLSRVPSSAYSNSGYDRGHMAPNHAIAMRYGEAAQRETFLMSNIVPQRHALNAGVWKELEMKIATSYPARFGEVWVLAGPIFGDRPARLGGGGPAVPAAFFMIVVDENDGRVRSQAFVFPQETPAGAEPGRHVVSIDEIEKRTGLDFLSDLEDGVEAALEAKKAQAVW